MSNALAGVREVVARTVGFAGGVNMRASISQLAPDEARKLENGVLDELGAFSKRLGCLSHGTFGSSSDRILSGAVFYRAGSAPQVIIQTTAGKLYYTNDPTTTSISWTQFATGLSVTAPMSFETFNKKLYMSNGVDSYASWDGTTYTTFASAPKGKFLRLWKDTMWVSGVATLEDRVYSSDPGNAEVFGVASWVDIAKGDGDQVTALGSDGLFLIVFKLNRYFIIYDPGLFSNRVVDYEKGCESHFSVIQMEGTIYFLSRRGICEYFSDSPARIISGKVDPLFDPAVLNLSSLSTAFAYSVGNQVGWALPEVGSTIPTLQLEYYPRLGVITPYGNRGTGPFVFHRIPAGVFMRWRYQGTEYLFGASLTANKLLRIFAPIGTDDGSMFTATLETGAYDFSDMTRTKYIRTVRVLGRGDVTFQLKRNFQSAIYKTFPLDLSSADDTWSPSDSWGSGTWGPDSVFQESKFNPDAYGRYFQLRFTDSSTDTGRKLLEVGSREYSLTAGEWGVYGVVMDAMILGRRD